MGKHVLRCSPWTICLLLVCSNGSGLRADAAVQPPSFGTVRTGAGLNSIVWRTTAGASVTDGSIELTQPKTVLRSETLPLRPLHLYELSTTMARGPGARVLFSIVYTDAKGTEQRWVPYWQIPGSTRADWTPLSPQPQRYVQGFVLPPDAHAPWLELQLQAVPQSRLAPYCSWTLTQLSLEERPKVACCSRIGSNQLIGGDMEAAGSDDLPVGWTQWGKSSANGVQLVESEDATRKRVLRVHTGVQTLLAASEVGVTAGSAWRLSLWARGTGTLQLFAHALSDDQPSLRVGWPQTREFALDAKSWKRLELIWFAEAPNVQAAQVVISVRARSDVDIDSVEFRPFTGP